MRCGQTPSIYNNIFLRTKCFQLKKYFQLLEIKRERKINRKYMQIHTMYIKTVKNIIKRIILYILYYNY